MTNHDSQVERPRMWTIYAAILGGVLGVTLAPIMVIIKYMTGWNIIPQPGWIDMIVPKIEPLLSFGTPVYLWILYGSFYTLALTLMFIGLVTLLRILRPRLNRTQKISYWVLMVGFALVLIGDGVHTATWHQNGLTIPTPGTNIIANSGYATQMMGMNLVLIGALIFGVSSLRTRLLSNRLAWLFVLILPSAPIASLTILPTSPSGGLWFFSLAMIMIGYTLITPQSVFAK